MKKRCRRSHVIKTNENVIAAAFTLVVKCTRLQALSFSVLWWWYVTVRRKGFSEDKHHAV